MSSVKCPKCGLVNFAGDEKCKRCSADLSASAAAVEAESAERAQASRNPNLSPCPDCASMISSKAEACPNCGRYIQRFREPLDARKGYGLLVFSVIAGIGALLCALAGLVVAYVPGQLVGGDAFNYEIAAGRGAVLVGCGVLLAVVSAGLGVSAKVAEYR